MANTYTKDADANLDFTFDWSDWLATGETISTFTITEDTGITSGTESQSGGIVTYWLSGGTVGTNYKVACKIVTSAGRTDERSVTVKVVNR